MLSNHDLSLATSHSTIMVLVDYVNDVPLNTSWSNLSSLNGFLAFSTRITFHWPPMTQDDPICWWKSDHICCFCPLKSPIFPPKSLLLAFSSIGSLFSWVKARLGPHWVLSFGGFSSTPTSQDDPRWAKMTQDEPRWAKTRHCFFTGSPIFDTTFIENGCFMGDFAGIPDNFTIPVPWRCTFCGWVQLWLANGPWQMGTWWWNYGQSKSLYLYQWDYNCQLFSREAQSVSMLRSRAAYCARL